MKRKEFLLTAGSGAISLVTSMRDLSGRLTTDRSDFGPLPRKAVVPAVLVPIDDRGSIDYVGFRKHITNLGKIDGVTAIMVNGGSGHDKTLTREEKRKLVAETINVVGERMPVIAAVRESDLEADLGLLAKDALEEGAAAITMMPPASDLGFSREVAKKRFDNVSAVVDLPLVIYQTRYQTETLVWLSENYPVVAVKEGSGDPATFERNMRALRNLDKNIAIWSTHSKWLLADLAVGADGILSGMGSVAAELQAALLRSAQGSDLPAAREVNDRLFPMTQAFYAPGQDAHVRMKYALVKLGLQQYAHVRPPLQPLDTKEREAIDRALALGGLL